MLRFGLLISLLFGFTNIDVAQAQTIKSSIEGIANALDEEGYQAKIERSEDQSFIVSSTAGNRFAIFLSDCDGDLCETMQFYAGFEAQGRTISLGKLNQWNADRRFGRAYRDSDGDAVVEMDVNMVEQGISKELFADNLSLWTAIVSTYSGYFEE